MLWAFSSMAADDVSPVTAKQDSPTNTSANNSTVISSIGNHFDFKDENTMIQRALYVLIGITVIGVLYFLVRAVRLKKPIQKKKYGLLSNYDDNVEMAALESDEDETVYEARSLTR